MHGIAATELSRRGGSQDKALKFQIKVPDPGFQDTGTQVPDPDPGSGFQVPRSVQGFQVPRYIPKYSSTPVQGVGGFLASLSFPWFPQVFLGFPRQSQPADGVCLDSFSSNSRSHFRRTFVEHLCTPQNFDNKISNQKYGPSILLFVLCFSFFLLLYLFCPGRTLRNSDPPRN